MPTLPNANSRSFFGPEAEEASVVHTKMRVGRLKKPWIKNCLAIGLSAAFIEPLESTGLYFIEIALRLLADYLDLDGADDIVRDSYNKTSALIYDNIAEFILMHYVLSKRDDTDFWRDARAAISHAPQLTGMLRLWTFKAPTDSDLVGPTTPFGASNYAAILFGMNRVTAGIPGPVRHISVEQSMEYYNTLKNVQQTAVKALPSHDQYLQKYTAAFSESVV